MKTPPVDTVLAILTALCVSYSSAQDVRQPEVYKGVLPSLMALQTKNTEARLFVGSRCRALIEGLVIAPATEDAESVFVRFSDVREFGVSGFVGEHKRIDLVRRVPHSNTLFESLREEMKSWTAAVPDFSTSWLGISCFVRNPLRYMLVPESSFAQELGLRAGDWILSVDGLSSNALQDLEIGLQIGFGKTLNIVVKGSDTSYRLGVAMHEKLPWE